jgi:hypothetical protein
MGRIGTQAQPYQARVQAQLELTRATTLFEDVGGVRLQIDSESAIRHDGRQANRNRLEAQRSETLRDIDGEIANENEPWRSA